MVRYDGKPCVLKDAWVEVSRLVAEYPHLEHIAGVQGLPVLFCGGDARVDWKLLCTSNIRKGLGTKLQKGRIRSKEWFMPHA